MDSSSFCELTLHQGGACVGSARAGVGHEVRHAVAEHELDGSGLVVEVRRGGATTSALRVHLGDEVVLDLPRGSTEGTVACETLSGEYGEVVFTCEQVGGNGSGDDDADESKVLIELAAFVRAPRRVIYLQEAVVEDIERAHEALALDIVSRTTHRRGAAGRLRATLPDVEIRRLDGLSARMDAALSQIGEQPSAAMVRDESMRRWRAGNRVRPANLLRVATDPEARIVGGRVVAIGRAVVETQRLTIDIGEHRQIRAGIDRLRDRCAHLQAWCERASSEYAREGVRWSNDRGEGSIYRRDIAPRVERLLELAEHAAHIRRRLARLIRTHDFVCDAGPVRGVLKPTPIFLGRAGYREAYGVLREIAQGGLISLAGEEVRIRFKALSRLYEYWVFVRIVRALGDLIGPPVLPQSFRVVDEIYRPDLEPGQTFRFTDPAGAVVFVTYEPDIVPALRRRHDRASAMPTHVNSRKGLTGPVDRPSLTWVASLSTAPLRPDVLVEVCIPGLPVVAMALDAKSGWNFSRDRLWTQTDYRTLVMDPADGRQPIRQMFFLHPNADLFPLESMPDYLSGRRGDIDNSIIGAASFHPAVPDRGIQVLARFLELAGVNLSAPST